MHSLRSSLAALCQGLVLASAVAQGLRFQHLTTDHGLSDNSITCILEDHGGYIWIGTERGLNRFDGQRVDRFPPGATGPLGAHVTSLAEDGRGRLWISTADGGLSMRDEAGRFTHIKRDSTATHGIPGGLNHVLVIDDSLLLVSARSRGAIWYHLRKGIIHRLGFRPVVINAKGDTTRHAEDDWCHSATRLDDARAVITTLRAGGPHVVDIRTGRDLTWLKTDKLLVTNCSNTDGTLFMGGWMPGLYRADPDVPGSVQSTPVDEEITAITEWNEERMIAATKVGGLLWFDKKGTLTGRTRHVRSDASSLRSDRTTCLLRDRSGNLWVGTAKGLSVHAPSVWPFDVVPLFPADRSGDLVFHAILEDADGTIRLSTSKGFILVDPQRRTSRFVELSHKGITLEVTGLFHPKGDDHFIGTETGIFRYDPMKERILPEAETGKWSTYHTSSMFQTRSVEADTATGLLVIGALGFGHIAVDARTGKRAAHWVEHEHVPGRMMLRSTVQDEDGSWWSATSGGVVRWKPVAVGAPTISTVFDAHVGPPQRLAGNDAQALAIRGDTVWVALRDAGLAAIVGGQAFAYAPPAHLPGDLIGITTDRSGKVWCTTSNGLVRYTPGDGSWLHVPVNDGRDFRQLTKCILLLRDGRIALCAEDHLLLFDPGAFEQLPALPAPALVRINNTWGDLHPDARGALELPFSNSAFDAMLTALQPVGAQGVSFLYRLDSELDDSWHLTDALTPVRYAGVPVGNHRLLVRVRDAYGREGPEQAMLAISVAGPFYQRWWFFALVLAAGASGMYLISQVRRKQRARLQGVRDRIARDLHDDIGSTLGSISFYSEALKRKLRSSDDGMTQEVAERIGSSSREMIDRMSDIVWSVDPNKDDTGALIERLQTFAKDLLSAKDIALRFSADAALNPRKLSAEQRRNLFLICKEALHNAVKYAEARVITIDVRSEQGLTISISDDGLGFDPENAESYNGNGLVNMRTRAGSVHAQLDIKSTPGMGTTVRVKLPAHVLIPRSGD